MMNEASYRMFISNLPSMEAGEMTGVMSVAGKSYPVRGPVKLGPPPFELLLVGGIILGLYLVVIVVFSDTVLKAVRKRVVRLRGLDGS